MAGPLYPALEELTQPILREQITILKNQLESERPHPSLQLKFNYAWALIKSADSHDQKHGIHILSKLLKEAPSFRRDCLYYLSLGSYKVADYSNARRYVDTLLLIEPENLQAILLKKEIELKVTNEGLLFLGITAGVIAVAGGVIGGLMRKKR